MDYSCICCGTCCQKYQPWLTSLEVDEIARQLNITTENFILEYTDRRWPGTESFLLIHTGNACVFLRSESQNGLSLCSVQAFKPACCSAWSAGLNKSECRTGLRKALGIEVDTSAHMKATAVQLIRLAERLKSIQNL